MKMCGQVSNLYNQGMMSRRLVKSMPILRTRDCTSAELSNLPTLILYSFFLFPKLKIHLIGKI